jgi:hypothetical protein
LKPLRIALVFLLLVCWAVGLFAVFGSGLPTTAAFRAAMLAVFVLNILCGFWLYRVSDSNSIEWALFGLLGNVNAIFFYWMCRHFIPHVVGRWKNGRHFFT